METITQLLPECPWSSFLPPTIKFCEDNVCSFIRQPSNTWSNLFFILVGIYLILKNREDKIASIRFIGPIAVLTGLASFLYHASFTFLFQYLDLSSMFLFSSMLVSFNLRRLKIISAANQNILLFALLLTSMGVLYIFKAYGILIFALQLLAAFTIEFNLFKRSNNLYSYFYYKITLFLFAFAYLAWILDFKKIICNPTNHFLQGHAIWHILSSFCFYSLYKFYSQKHIESII